MITKVVQKDSEELYETPIVQQTAYWSVLKRKMGHHIVAINFSTTKASLFHHTQQDQFIVSDLLVIIQQIDQQHSIAYVPYGPELEPDEDIQGLFLEELSESLRSFLPKDCIMIRYDLHWESYWAKDKNNFDQQGHWLGEPGLATQEFRFNFNTINWNFEKAYSNILPSNTIFINLRKSTTDILNGMKPKTRYNIRLAQRKNVVVNALGIENLDIWYKLYRETASRNNIFVNDMKYFETVLTTKANDSLSPAEVFLLVAEYQEIPLAAMFLIITSNRASYLYGASSSKNRNIMATYALQWEAMKFAKAKGCTEYDMFGVAPRPEPSHPMYGLYKFKIGFGGNIFHSLGCWDYPLNAEKYNRFKSTELNSQGFHTN
ncbi:MAG: peptidoglycan bridge formation glycyltransferase FemA/FemB family protein [Bacteroidetes bacterium]|nr:peptidoglycan bridge formation glycyltransferase FemA/FemB family protein [Bacteroidota bacterium]